MTQGVSCLEVFNGRFAPGQKCLGEDPARWGRVLRKRHDLTTGGDRVRGVDPVGCEGVAKVDVGPPARALYF